jgi:hypothetical protein
MAGGIQSEPTIYVTAVTLQRNMENYYNGEFYVHVAMHRNKFLYNKTK